MSSELFHGYTGVKERDGNIAAAQIAADNIVKLSQFTGGTAVTKTVRGGTRQYCGLILHGEEGKVGDYVIADYGNTYRVFPKVWFENTYRLKGVLRDNVI